MNYIARKDYSYDLPPELIAQHGCRERDHSRLLVIPAEGPLLHRHFYDLPDFLRPGDLLVFNNSKVIPARLIGVDERGGAVELLLLKRLSHDDWECIGKPGRKLRVGARLEFIPSRLSAEVLKITESGERHVRFYYTGIWEEILDLAGEMPLPPYIHEKLEDPSRYNTVYAKVDGSAAAPTAGLHFTAELLSSLDQAGVERAELTLHVGLGTFRPVKADNILEHEMHAETYQISEETAFQINRAKREGRRVIAVGTTAARVLETVADAEGRVEAGAGETSLYIYPPYRFKVLDGLITNFHLPESTLLLLVAALCGKERLFEAYAEAVEKRYRFFSFGDACLFLPHERGEDWQ